MSIRFFFPYLYPLTVGLVVFSGESALLHAAEPVPSTARYYGDVPKFTELSERAGITHEYRGPWEYFVGGGVAVFDCNGDRKPDLFLAGGESSAALYLNTTQKGHSPSFVAVEDFSNARLNRVTGAYPLDIDNDGNLDLAILRVGRNRLLRGLGDCRFDASAESFKINSSSAWTTAFSAIFETGKTRPTLVFGNYVDRLAPGSPWGTCDSHQLYRPQGRSRAGHGGTPQDSRTVLFDKPAVLLEEPVALFDEPIDLAPGHCTLSMLFTDWNRSGKPSLRVTNDRHYHRGGQEQLWHFDSGASPRLYTGAEGWKQVVIWGMGIASADLDADGYPEYALTSMGDTKLQKLDFEAFEESGWPVYRDIAFELGATAHRPYRGDDLKPSTGWHAEFDDVNNDGLLDLFIAKGNVEQMPDFAGIDPDNLLLGQHDGSFFEAGGLSGIGLATRGRGGAVVDLDLDGLLDIVVVNRNANVSIFRNEGMQHLSQTRQGGNWLQIEIEQDGINRNAIGATLAIKSGNTTRIRTLHSGGGHASGALGFVHVGLGVAERAQVRIRWPDGQWSAPYRVFANNFVLIKRNAEVASYWYPE